MKTWTGFVWEGPYSSGGTGRLRKITVEYDPKFITNYFSREFAQRHKIK